MRHFESIFLPLVVVGLSFATVSADDLLPGTTVLEWRGDLASKMVDGIDRFLLRKLEEAPGRTVALLEYV